MNDRSWILTAHFKFTVQLSLGNIIQPPAAKPIRQQHPAIWWAGADNTINHTLQWVVPQLSLPAVRPENLIV